MDMWIWVAFGGLLVALALREVQIASLERKLMNQNFLIESMRDQLDECGVDTFVSEDLSEIRFTEQELP